MHRTLTYENGLEISKTFIIYTDNKNQYIKYLRELATENNAEVLVGIADGLEKKYKNEDL